MQTCGLVTGVLPGCLSAKETLSCRSEHPGKKLASQIRSSRWGQVVLCPLIKPVCHPSTKRKCLRCQKNDSISSSPLVSELMEDGAVMVRDDLDMLLQVLPADLRGQLLKHSRRAELLEVILDLGRRPEARFLGDGAGECLRTEEITRDDLQAAQAAVGEFGGDNRAGIEGTLHRISAIRSRKGQVVGLTCRVGRAVTGHIDMVRDVLHSGQSILFLGRPGVGKTTVIREIARVLADELHKRVVIVDTSNEIGGDGDVAHGAIGGARRMQVPDPSMQHKVMVEAVENHMPEVVIVDEIGSEAEALACRTIAERGVMLVGTAHGQMLENIIKNPTLCDLVGGVQTVTLGDEEARARGTQKSVLERKAPPTFPILIEMRERSHWVAHQTDRSVDALLHGRRPFVERIVELEDELRNYVAFLVKRDKNGNQCRGLTGHPKCWVPVVFQIKQWEGPVSVRTRDDKFKVVIERKLYDSHGSGRLDGSDYERGNGSSLLSILGGLQSPTDDPQDSYSWASRLGYVMDKDAMADSAFRDDAHGYSSSGSPGKRGSKRGPRGMRPRHHS